jgi:hypothetical protein
LTLGGDGWRDCMYIHSGDITLVGVEVYTEYNDFDL